jgi:hypothetical protein
MGEELVNYTIWNQIDQLVASHFYNLKLRNYPDPLEN